MRSIQRQALPVVAIGLAGLLLLSFNNCSDNFKVNYGEEKVLHEASTINQPVNIYSTAQNMFFTGRDLVFTSALGDGISSSSAFEWSYSLDGAPQGCNVLSSTISSFRINCPTKTGALVIKYQVMINGVALQATEPLQFNLSQDPQAVPTSNEILFAIPLGTGSNPWNTVSNPIRAKIGQRIKIRNDDTIPHRLHTGGAPCPHGAADIQPGQTDTCVVGSAFTGFGYDHNLGTNAKVYFATTAP
jgi:hypothetical protein